MVSDNLLNFATKAYSFDKETLNFISDSTNQIYCFQKDGKTYALRFSNHAHLDAINAEMDWLYYLAENGVSVALPLKLNNGELAIPTKDGSEDYILTAFEFVQGVFWDKNNPEKWNEKIFYNWGKTMGDMHRLAKEYKPANDTDVRGEFNANDLLDEDAVKNIPAMKKASESVVAEINALPKDKDSYGLIHYDVHPWNFYIDGDKINVFDFDDCLYGWFALDIGIALYHGLWWGRVNDSGKDFANIMVDSFLKGYLSANKLSSFWLAKIPLFMRFRQLCKIIWFYDPSNTDAHQKERIGNIEKGVLFNNHELDMSLFA